MRWMNNSRQMIWRSGGWLQWFLQAAAALRLPMVWQGIQLVMDASGLGPRVLGNVT